MFGEIMDLGGRLFSIHELPMEDKGKMLKAIILFFFILLMHISQSSFPNTAPAGEIKATSPSIEYTGCPDLEITFSCYSL
jgi:hypothetical protein